MSSYTRLFSSSKGVICQIRLPYTGYFCPERLLCKSSNEKGSEICIREQFVTRMVRCGGEIENGDFDKGKNANVGFVWVCNCCYNVRPLVS